MEGFEKPGPGIDWKGEIRPIPAPFLECGAVWEIGCRELCKNILRNMSQWPQRCIASLRSYLHLRARAHTGLEQPGKSTCTWLVSSQTMYSYYCAFISFFISWVRPLECPHATQSRVRPLGFFALYRLPSGSYLAKELWKAQQRQRQAEDNNLSLQSGGNVSAQLYRMNPMAGDAASELTSSAM